MYISQFKARILRNIQGKIRKNIKYIDLFAFDYQHYHINVTLSEDLFEKYKEYHWNKPILNVSDLNNDIYLNFDWRTCKLIFYEGCKPKSRYNIVCNLFTLNNNKYQL
ncbi:MAG: hypothetical protein Ta2E_00530 [Mycoplasmoidaceae bacterium]|nr:MAG: hypothetical protein Ta2E_00530 [Mycoplasmoidaceae bacterium]